MKVLYFGTYSKGAGYPRNNTIIKGLRENGITVVECNREIFRGAEEKALAAKSPLALIRLLVRLSATYCFLIGKFLKIGNYDIIIIGYLGHFDLFVAKALNALTKKKPVVLDVFLSLFDSVVLDRKLVPQSSLKARLLWCVDKYACTLADLVLLDTKKHIEYFAEEFSLPEKKFIRVFVGNDERVKPGHVSKKPPTYNRAVNVLFFGTYLPLHGIRYILGAARLLKADCEVSFTLLGKGPNYEKMRSIASSYRLNNTSFVSQWTGDGELIRYIKHADICLGIFGDTPKTGRVIPCKVFNCLRQGKPVITGDSPAARELLTHKKDAYLCEPASEESIAEAIRILKRDAELRADLGCRALETYRLHGSPKIIGKRLIEELRKRG